MQWQKISFKNAIQLLVNAFQSSPAYDYLALVWREGDEYRVMQSWELKGILSSMREDRLRLVLWLNRAEAGIVLSPSVGPGR